MPGFWVKFCNWESDSSWNTVSSGLEREGKKEKRERRKEYSAILAKCWGAKPNHGIWRKA